MRIPIPHKLTIAPKISEIRKIVSEIFPSIASFACSILVLK